MKTAIAYISVILLAYLLSGINPAIILSNLVFHDDIRTHGSGNPGFTNFKRTYGKEKNGLFFTWTVFVLDLLKGVIVSLLAGLIFQLLVGDREFLGQMLYGRVLGVGISCIAGMLGHAFPVWYRFKGGKGFLFLLSSIFFLNPICGAIAFFTMFALLLTVKYMSLATCAGLTAGALALFIPWPEVLFPVHWIPAAMYLLCVLFMLYRHRENYVRLKNHTEKKTYIFKK